MSNANGRYKGDQVDDQAERPIPVQLTTLREVDWGELVFFTATILGNDGRWLRVSDGTDSALVELRAGDAGFAVGDLVEVTGRKVTAGDGSYVIAPTQINHAGR